MGDVIAVCNGGSNIPTICEVAKTDDILETKEIFIKKAGAIYIKESCETRKVDVNDVLEAQPDLHGISNRGNISKFRLENEDELIKENLKFSKCV